MAPIYDKQPLSTPAPPCPCDEVNKYWYFIIEPTAYGFPDMTLWSIDGVDFIIGANGVMTSYGGSGQSCYLSSPFIGTYNAGYIAYYGKFSALPQPEIKDPAGNIIFNSWGNINGAPCGIQNPVDFTTNLTFELPKIDKNISYLDLFWYDPQVWNTQTGYPNNNGTAIAIDISTMNGGPLDMGSPSADLTLKALIDPFFLNGVNVTLTPTPTHLQIRLDNLYLQRGGYYENATSKWKEMLRIP